MSIGVSEYRNPGVSVPPCKNVYKLNLKYSIVFLLGGGGGYYTTVAMRRLDERRVYYEHKKKKKKQEKKQLTNETFDSRPSDRMSLGINNNDTLDDSYIPGAY